MFQQHDSSLRELASSIGMGEIELTGNSAAMERLRLQVRRIGPHFRTVLVSGEPGCGKELVARALHRLSQGADRPFVVCHAATLDDAPAGQPDSNRANVGSVDRIAALMRTANGGTLFLDEIGEMPLEVQGELLRVLRRLEWSQDRLSATQKPGVRMIASSSQEIRGLVSAGRFRQELYRRIATLEITVPPLKERMEDLPELAGDFLGRFALMYGKRVERIAEDAMERLMTHRWPGNVRELENLMRNSVLLSDGVELLVRDLPEFAADLRGDSTTGGVMKLEDVVERHVLHVLKICSGNKLRAAEVLGISRSTLYRMLEGLRTDLHR